MLPSSEMTYPIDYASSPVKLLFPECIYLSLTSASLTTALWYLSWRIAPRMVRGFRVHAWNTQSISLLGDPDTEKPWWVTALPAAGAVYRAVQLCAVSGCSILFPSAEKNHSVERNGKIFIAKSLDIVSLKMMNNSEPLKLTFIKKRETKFMPHDKWYVA